MYYMLYVYSERRCKRCDVSYQVCSRPRTRFVAPHYVRISGRDGYKENSSINGEYELVKIVEGKPAYKKATQLNY